VQRREALTILLGVAAAACGGRVASPAISRPPPPPPLPVDAAPDLAAAAGLVWMVDLRLREIFASTDLIPAIALLFPEARLDRFATTNGGVDLRQLTELCVATYPETMLVVARGLFDDARLEKAFADRLEQVDGRAEDRATLPDGRAAAPITRIWGSARKSREQLALVSREAFAFERGRFGPLKAAELFAEGKLKKAKPALRTSPLDRVVELLGGGAASPALALAPGPFTGDQAKGVGGLLAAAFAVGISGRASAAEGGKARLDVRVVVTGAWGADGADAAVRLASEFDRLAQDALGHLCGLDRPLSPPKATSMRDAVVLDVALDPFEIARGLHDITEGTLADIMAY
jgi:hypothetical protein